MPSLDADALAATLAAALGDRSRSLGLARAAHAAAQGFGWDRAARQLEAVCGAP